ncbi:MAG: serine/threonine protein kinase [Planctomycetes bacterium]|nr:serine/threonine protein kinase [Planctomycetota bacterium]
MNASGDDFELDGLPVPDDSTGLQSRDSLELLLSQFADEVRAGSMPSIEDYVARNPHCAGEIRELFPLVFSLEQWKSNKEVECLRNNVPDDFSVEAFGDYKVVRELGRGGMGVVFYAVHTKSHRPVAVKLLPWRYAADMTRWKERFHREAATIAALRHKNIVQVYSFGRHEGYYYYVMQFVDGVGLDRIINRLRTSSRPCDASVLVAQNHPEGIPVPKPGEFPDEAAQGVLVLMRDSWRGFARLGEQVASALAHAHQHDALHNDIKPSNLLVKQNGQVIVTDFGIGRLNADGEELDQHDNAQVGTLRYTAPERLHGQIDARCDIYALGITMYELVTQVTPFESINRAELLNRVIHEELPPPSKIMPQIPYPLETIILKAIAREPDDRYATAIEMADDLRRFINGQRIHATRKSLLQKAIKWYQAIRSKSRRI